MKVGQFSVISIFEGGKSAVCPDIFPMVNLIEYSSAFYTLVFQSHQTFAEWLFYVRGHDTIKLLQENIGKTFSDINSTNVLLSQSPKRIEIKTKPNPPKKGLIKLTSFCTTKETIKKTKKTTYRMRENICKQVNWPGLNLQNIQTTHTTQQEKNKQPNQKKGIKPI